MTDKAMVTDALKAIVDFCDDPSGSEKPETLAQGLSRLLPAARAALAARTHPVVGDEGVRKLVERLRRHDWPGAEPAADTLEALLAERVRLREALAPFSDMVGEMFARNWERGHVALALDNPDDPHRLTFDDFVAARAALTPEAPTKDGGQ